ncbi:MAG: RNA polymerase sigma factor [Planctomycetota bacterium]
MLRERGEPSDFRRLFETHADGVFRYLYRLARDRHDAEDLLQETFVRLWRKRDQFRAEGSFAAYARRVAYRTFLNARPGLARRNGSLPIESCAEPADPRVGPEDRACRQDLERYLLDHVRRAIDALPDSLREPLVLFRYEGLPLKEIAAILDITPKAAEHRVSRALRRVAAAVEGLRTEYRSR